MFAGNGPCSATTTVSLRDRIGAATENGGIFEKLNRQKRDIFEFLDARRINFSSLQVSPVNGVSLSLKLNQFKCKIFKLIQSQGFQPF